MTRIRPPAVAGRFYPNDPAALRDLIDDALAKALPPRHAGAVKALIVPHAGYLYSGPIAATGYTCLAHCHETLQHVVLLGTAHSRVEGLAAPSAEAFATPFGDVAIDHAALAAIRELPQVTIDDFAHAHDHALEVQLPFLQTVLGEFRIVPLLVGRVAPQQVAEVLEMLWDGPETLIVVSSDLSHYYDAETARILDQTTARAIEALRPDQLGPESACGHRAISGLLLVARGHGLRAITVDLRNSSDTAGPRDRVVGYGAFMFVAPERRAAEPPDD
jgi:AmmeMemoRadiSam system protein B